MQPWVGRNKTRTFFLASDLSTDMTRVRILKAFAFFFYCSKTKLCQLQNRFILSCISPTRWATNVHHFVDWDDIHASTIFESDKKKFSLTSNCIFGMTLFANLAVVPRHITLVAAVIRLWVARPSILRILTWTCVRHPNLYIVKINNTHKLRCLRRRSREFEY